MLNRRGLKRQIWVLELYEICIKFYVVVLGEILEGGENFENFRFLGGATTTHPLECHGSRFKSFINDPV